MVIGDGFSTLMANMIESNRNWNLANDVELLKRLEKFAEDVINSASMTLTSMDDLEDSLNGTFLRVRTVANKFQAIADNQFIENRVQEEEDFELASDKKAETLERQLSPEASKAQLLESINECRNALSNKFETVQVSGIDFEDEMANSRPIVLVSKNVYKERRLPHLIGGERFIADETVGLMENDDLMEDSFEREEDADADETDRSSYYASSNRKFEEQADQVNFVSPPPVLEKNPAPTASPVRSFKSPIEEPTSQVEDDSEELFRENKSNSLFDDVSVPTLSNSIGNQSTFGSFDEKSDPPKTESPKEEEPIKSSIVTPRDQLLAGRNFASFKEDLARVLSRSQPFAAKKQHSSDSDGSKADFSSPSNDELGDDIFKEPEENIQSPPKSSGSSTAISTSLLPSRGSAELSRPVQRISPGITNSDILPNVTTNTLESLAKGRAKVKGKRRPPSRKHRQASVEEGGTGTSQDSEAVPSNSTQSEDMSTQESTSTQPGSNILSPATDEEDLFVLPAFDLPTDPPSRGLFFGNSLLSPGAAIDDGGSTSSPLFPPSESTPSPSSEFPAEPKPRKSLPRVEPTPGQSQPPTVTRPPPPAVTDPLSDDTSSDLFSSIPPPSLKPTVQPAATQPQLGEDDLFSSKTTSKTKALQDDLFSSGNSVSVFSSSPPLFTDWSNSIDEQASDKKPKRSLQSGLKWDLLSSDDLSEDLFRAQTGEPPKPSKAEEPQRTDASVVPKSKDSIFSPTNFEKTSDPMFFEDDDDNSYSSTDIFSGSNAFMRLNLPKNKNDSLFASDDEDDDDDSLFKTSKMPTSASPNETSFKLPGPLPRSSQVPSSSPRERIKDPLMSMDDSE